MRRPSLRGLLATVGWLGVVAGLGSMALCLSARWHWSGEIACSFRWYVGWIGLVAVLPLAAARRWRAVALTMLVFGWHLAPELTLYFPGESAPRSAAAGVRVATANVLDLNRDPRGFRAWLAECDPDVLVVQEVNRLWHDVLAEFDASYPHRLEYPDAFHDTTFGIALLSKAPLSDTSITPVEGNVPILRARVGEGPGCLTLVGVHPTRPGRGERTPRRNRALREMERVVANDSRAILLGDLNTTSGSPAFSDLLAGTGLRDSRRGFGRQPTRRSSRPVPGLELALDHILVGADVVVLDRRVGPAIGSDHRPVWADIALAAPAESGAGD